MFEQYPYTHKDIDYDYIHKIGFLKVCLILKVFKFSVVKKNEGSTNISPRKLQVYERIIS